MRLLEAELKKLLGTISKFERGSGWGFDPIFIPKNKILTFGEMKPEQKDSMSHRAKAFEKFKENIFVK